MSPNHPVKNLEGNYLKKDLPSFRVGDTVKVHYLIKEGDKERIQIFQGTVIRIKKGGVRGTFTVRRIVAGEGVERIFPLHSPRVKDVDVTRRGKVRRSRLYYLRDRVGKATKVKELVGSRKGKGAKPAHPGNHKEGETAKVEA